jgi:hypothetical protein
LGISYHTLRAYLRFRPERLLKDVATEQRSAGRTRESKGGPRGEKGGQTGTEN